MPPKALILFAPGTNRDLDVARALEQAGAEPEVVHLNQLRRGERRWQDYQMLVLPGGFSYADALGAGKLLKSGLLPDPARSTGEPQATLTFNAGGHFECRWVTLLPVSQTCVWTRGLNEPIDCPIAHGEGNFQAGDPRLIEALVASGQAALLYAAPDGRPAGGVYPHNPNGSAADIAGLCNPAGNVLGLMPHPEDHIFAGQHPLWTRGLARGSGLALFRNGVNYANQF
jgi:phosphoribosylformylglycinamidine (FGAM) synthase-like amidotransferase family enzyme